MSFIHKQCWWFTLILCLTGLMILPATVGATPTWTAGECNTVHLERSKLEVIEVESREEVLELVTRPLTTAQVMEPRNPEDSMVSIEVCPVSEQELNDYLDSLSPQSLSYRLLVFPGSAQTEEDLDYSTWQVGFSLNFLY